MPISDDAVCDKWIALREFLCSFVRREDSHRALFRIGKWADHQKRAARVEFRPPRTVRGEVERRLRAQVVRGFVEEDVFHAIEPGYCTWRVYQTLPGVVY